ncbi:hypothetical protein VF14_08800 [Nostoc linckia z18]|uniref:Uncharacterized protein n=2 Tax=Nostoc linckia TaxID=92942 RepID=A0A9Q5ZEK8_NOSLI|nr:hypothetical protein [Nostoc linckia]PHK42546.1 hypothetical protein VF12_02445 [Nostoc linckia z15]PHK44520.1 hypothetical protein VF13_21145 [Nostoc linckia z16]PHJ59566.1 hypothetical protein VF02_24425 [Nostoc linckia z1]PHJ65157.1 hypothetical protein VF05_21725 [Nostoc linckia z3]PHJ69569.1 hypothetical protein VF03_23505 [Nostoc linckia z2]
MTQSWTYRCWQDIYLYEWSDKKLDDVLPPEVDHLTRKAACERFYGKSLSTLKRDLSCLVVMGIKPKGFTFEPQDEGFNRTTLEVLFEFRKLVKRYQYESAVEKICRRMEEIYELQKCQK